MYLIRALSVIFGCLAVGEAVIYFTGLRLPGSIIRHGIIIYCVTFKMGECGVAARFGGHHDGKFIAVFSSSLCGGDELFRIWCRAIFGRLWWQP